MATKSNNGNQPQPFAPKGSTDDSGNPNGGQFLPKDEQAGSGASDSDGKKYYAETDITDEELDSFLSSKFGQKYDSLNDDVKAEKRKMLRDKLRSAKTKNTLSARYDDVSDEQYEEFNQQCEDRIRSIYGSEASDLLDWFYDRYAGTPRSFDLNKALRLGYEGALEWYDEAMKSSDPRLATYQSKVRAFPSEEEINEFAEAFDKLTSAFEMPENKAVYRFVNDDVIASWFEDLFKRNGLDVTKGIWGYKISDSSKLSVDQMVDMLQDAVGQKVDGDKGFSSFSTLKNNSHMKSSKGSDFRRIQMVYDLPKGQKCFISKYEYESEGVLPRGLKFVVKSVEKESEANEERVVIRIGII